jgi:hypothetical protein
MQALWPSPHLRGSPSTHKAKKVDDVKKCYAVNEYITLEESYTSGRYDVDGREVRLTWYILNHEDRCRYGMLRRHGKYYAGRVIHKWKVRR